MPFSEIGRPRMSGLRSSRAMSDTSSAALAVIEDGECERVPDLAGVGQLAITVAFGSERAMLEAWDRVASRCHGLSAYRWSLEGGCELDRTRPASCRYAVTLLGEDDVPSRVTFERVHWLLRRTGRPASIPEAMLSALREQRAAMLAIRPAQASRRRSDQG